MATNCLGPFILNRLPEPILIHTARAESSPDGARIIWVSMITTSVPLGGMQFSKESGGPKVSRNRMQDYMQSKVDNIFLASEAAKRMGEDGIINIVS